MRRRGERDAERENARPSQWMEEPGTTADGRGGTLEKKAEGPCVGARRVSVIYSHFVLRLDWSV